MSPRWLIGLALAALAPAAPAEVAVTDAVGREVTLERPAERVVSLAPSLTETLFAIGAGERLVGTVNYSNHPPEAEEVPRVGGYHAVNLEAVLALEPDLVVAWREGNSRRDVERLMGFGLTVYVSDPQGIEDVPALMRDLGRLTGVAHEAQAEAAAFEARYQALRVRHADAQPIRVYYQVWDSPLKTIGARQHITELIRLCGGENVFAHINRQTLTHDAEAVLVAEPQVVIAGGMAETGEAWLERWQRWPSIPAVGAGALFYLDPDIVQRAGPRLIEGAERLCEVIDEGRQKNAES